MPYYKDNKADIDKFVKVFMQYQTAMMPTCKSLSFLSEFGYESYQTLTTLFEKETTKLLSGVVVPYEIERLIALYRQNSGSPPATAAEVTAVTRDWVQYGAAGPAGRALLKLTSKLESFTQSSKPADLADRAKKAAAKEKLARAAAQKAGKAAAKPMSEPEVGEQVVIELFKFISSRPQLRDMFSVSAAVSGRLSRLQNRLKSELGTYFFGRIRSAFWDSSDPLDISSNFLERLAKDSEALKKNAASERDMVQGVARVKEMLQSGEALKILEDADDYIKNFDERNAEELEKKSEEDADAPLGRIAFAPARSDVPYEENTEEEEKIWDSVKDHVRDNVPIKQKAGQEIVDIMDSDLYNKVLAGPTRNIVYRGMSVKEPYIRNALKLPAKEKLSDTGDVKTGFTYTPKDGWSSSWSASSKKAQDFADKANKGEYALVLHAYTEKNDFLDLRQSLYDTEDLQQYQNEQETIGLGPVKVFKIRWKLKK